MPNPRHSSESIEHFTPPEIIEAARQVLGVIDLDPASSKLANDRLVHAKTFYDLSVNGFVLPWKGRVFLNPPGGLCTAEGIPIPKEERKRGKSSMKLWWDRLAREWMRGTVSSAVFVGFSVELLQSAQAFAVHPLCFPMCVPAQRLRFITLEDGWLKPGKQPTHANFVAFLPDRDDTVRQVAAFMRLFVSFGWAGPGYGMPMRNV